ncbi:hypothetical protein [Natronorubrum thiooxidans]|uniref:Uncharacterized protein n=1 Tax=Natronorubrum thiooxidans TaxID=308853 RepID=A0A1N7GLQ5_9EURY|nr:hypothetical protein [Natronorubrum thiooxidans]SIS13436.1 hypothetical protein SAMN05421752_11346 [Natronorubrum thiooxidans]
MSTQDQSPTHDQAAYVATCPECDVEFQTDIANEIIEFYRRHYRVTGHHVVFDRTQLDLDEEVTGTDLKDVVWQLQNQYENGVPIGIISAVMSERGTSIGETLDEIHKVRMTGGLYEPRDDHLGAF